ncbi:MAG: lipopolysaccharide biosynthesis protein, partial [Lachnospiraceae bacterium]|nr:lipopolysaccharide biosynthesis protein [Lachnospiraceae bacterium]
MDITKIWKKYKSSQIEYDGFIFNSLGGLLNAFQSVFVLMVLSRVMPTLEEAGVFTFAYSVANLMLDIGRYGMRNYQVTDVKEKYAYSTYFKSRVLTTVAMMVVSVVYVVVRNGIEGYTVEKVWIIIFMCLFKAVDSMEDIYYGRYQQVGRLDIAGKCLTVHMLMVILSYVLCLVAGADLLASTVVTTFVSAVVTLVLILPTRKMADPDWKSNAKLRSKESSWPLLWECTGLAIALFLSFYQVNCPKYAIDSVMTDVDQANFGFISMPVFFASL